MLSRDRRGPVLGIGAALLLLAVALVGGPPAALHAGSSLAPLAQAQTTDWSSVEQAIDKSGAAQPGDVYRFSFPRTDLQVSVRGERIQPALALGLNTHAGHVTYGPVAEAHGMQALTLAEALS